MAVIKEQKQFKIGSIGVARASEGSTIIGNAVTNSMTKLAGIAADEATFYAAKTGIEEGSKVVTIDPMTGMPNALDVPTGFGRLAAEAYTRTAMTRFDRSIETEIKLKSAELSVKYEKSGNAAVLYEKAMKDYIDSMTDAASEAYKPVVADKGLEYIAITTYNLAEAQRQREFADAASAHDESMTDALQNIENLRSQIGPSKRNSDGTVIKGAVEFIAESTIVLSEDGRQAKYYNESQDEAFNEQIVIADIRGTLTYLVNQEENPTVLALLQSAIATNNPNAIPEGYEDIKEAMLALGSDLTSKNEIVKLANVLIPKRSITANIITDAKNAEISRQIDLNAAIIKVTGKANDNESELIAEAVASQVSQNMNMGIRPVSRGQSVASQGPQLVSSKDLVNNIFDEYEKAQREMVTLTLQKKPLAATAILETQKHKARGSAKGLSIALISGLSVDGIGEINQAIKTGDYSNIDPFKKQMLKDITRLSIIDKSIETSFEKFMKNITENADLIVQIEQLKTSNGREANALAYGNSPNAATGRVADSFIKGYEIMNKEYNELIASGYVKSAETLKKNFEKELELSVKGAIANILTKGNNGEGLNVNQTKAIVEATVSGDASYLPPKARAIFNNTLLRLQKETGVDAMSMLKTIADTYKSSGAQLVTEELERQAFAASDSFSSEITELSSMPFDVKEGSEKNSIEARREVLVHYINSINNLQKTPKENQLSEINQNAAKAYLSNFFLIDELKPTEGQIELAQSILSGGINIGEGENQLSKAQINFLKRARTLATESGKTSEVNTHFNELVDARKDEINVEKERLELEEKTIAFGQGRLDPSLVSSQEFSSNYIKNAFGITNLYERLQDRSFMRSSVGQSITNIIRATGVVPLEISSMLDNVAQGGLNNTNAASALELYSEFKYYTVGGQVLASTALSGLSPATEATLEFLMIATEVTGNDNDAIVGLVKQYEEGLKPDLKAFTDAKFADFLSLDTENGETLTTWMLENVKGADEIPFSYQPTLRVFAETLIRNSIMHPNLQSISQLKRTLDKHVEGKFPDPIKDYGSWNPFGTPAKRNRLVYAVKANDIGTGRRTGATLSQSVQGYEQEFADVVEQMIRTEGDVNPSSKIQLGPDFTLGVVGSVEAKSEETYFLQPTGPMMNGYVEYSVMQVTDAFGGSKQVMNTKTFYEVDGKKATTIKVPMFITNQNPNFLALRSLKMKGISIENLRSGMLDLKRREQGAAGEDLTPLPVDFDISDPSTYVSSAVNGIINAYQISKAKADRARKIGAPDWNIP